MNSVGPSLLDFSRASAQAADTSRIKVSGQNVGSTKLPTWASTNHAAMTAFVEAMRRELGRRHSRCHGDPAARDPWR